jgi:putative transport protein
MEWLDGMLHKYPELAVYLAVAVGYWVGQFRFGGFSFGAVTGSLLGGILVGYLFDVPVSSTAKSLLFLLFLFGIGYSVGPQFFKAMRGQGLRWALLATFTSCVGLLGAYAVARVLELDVGFAAGLLSGALTESPAIGTATEAIKSLPISEAEQQRLIGHIAVADALCYVFGAFGVIFSCSVLGPRLLGIDLRAEAEKLEAEMGLKRAKGGVASAWRTFGLRAYRVQPGGRVVGRTVAEAEALLPQARVFVMRIRRGEDILDATPDTVLREGDVLAVAGRSEVLIEVIGPHGEEISDQELLDVPVAAYDVLVTGKNIFAGRTLEDLGREDAVRGVFLREIRRGEQAIPIASHVTIERGDVLTIAGPEHAVVEVAALVGKVVRPTDTTDFVTLGLGIVVGALVGVAVAIPVGKLSISLGTSVGTLIAGLVVGWLRTRYPLFGRIPDAAISFMTSIGLAAFVAMIGMIAGPVFLTALREAGWTLLLGGAVVTLLPMISGLYFGRYVLKLNPLLLLGGLAGAQTMTAALAAVQDRSGSPIAVLGYSGTVAIGHVLLTTWGTVIVLLLS